MLAISGIFICASPFIQKAENEKITYELSVTEVQSELNTLSELINNLKEQSKEISNKSINIVSDITSEKQTIELINAQIKDINEETNKILEKLNTTNEKQKEN